MTAVFLNGKALNPTSIKLPLLIHGKDKSGASYFTMNLVLNFLAAGSKILFYSAFQPARDFLIENTLERETEFVTSSAKQSAKKLVIPMSGDQKLFRNILAAQLYKKHLIIIKNIELLEPSTMSLLQQRSETVYSGDSLINSQLELPSMASTILFSDIDSFMSEDVQLNTYEGYYVEKGIVKLGDE